MSFGLKQYKTSKQQQEQQASKKPTKQQQFKDEIWMGYVKSCVKKVSAHNNDNFWTLVASIPSPQG